MRTLLDISTSTDRMLSIINHSLGSNLTFCDLIQVALKWDFKCYVLKPTLVGSTYPAGQNNRRSGDLICLSFFPSTQNFPEAKQMPPIQITSAEAVQHLGCWTASGKIALKEKRIDKSGSPDHQSSRVNTCWQLNVPS